MTKRKKPLSNSPAERDQRLAEYARLRDTGMRITDVMREMGISDGTKDKYERWYRAREGAVPAPRAIKGWVDRWL